MNLPIAIAPNCAQCGTQLAPTMTACPVCGKLVHTEKLAQLADTARKATDRGDILLALQCWREALELLPAGSKQHQIVSGKITELGPLASSTVPATDPTAKPKTIGSRITGGLGALALLGWKLKTVVLGLTKATTLFSMLLSFGVYWTVWGWPFAAGLVLSIYVHEMGHVIALRRLGFKATSPMFIPGLGALIRLQQQVVNPDEDAEIGLAGPIYGLGAAIVALVIWQLTHRPIFAAIAGVGAWVNLFNLMPIWTLDGGRGFHAMSRLQKVLAALTAAGAWYLTGDGLLILLALVGGYRVVIDPVSKGNWKPTVIYIGLMVALTTVSLARTFARTG